MWRFKAPSLVSWGSGPSRFCVKVFFMFSLFETLLTKVIGILDMIPQKKLKGLHRKDFKNRYCNHLMRSVRHVHNIVSSQYLLALLDHVKLITSPSQCTILEGVRMSNSCRHYLVLTEFDLSWFPSKFSLTQRLYRFFSCCSTPFSRILVFSI